MLFDQGKQCAICEADFGDTPCVDHCHESGAVRGLLCRSCNTLLGQAKDNTTILQAACNYLNRRNNAHHQC